MLVVLLVLLLVPLLPVRLLLFAVAAEVTDVHQTPCHYFATVAIRFTLYNGWWNNLLALIVATSCAEYGVAIVFRMTAVTTHSPDHWR